MVGEREECGSCKFWLERSDHAKKLGGGFCRRYPPNWPAQLNAHASIDPHARGVTEITPESRYLNDSWPMVHQQSWCGEFTLAAGSSHAR